MQIILVRHGQSEYNVGLTHFLDSSLTKIGRRQATITAEVVCRMGLTHLYCSPLRRALETMRPFQAITGLPVELAADACEFFGKSEYLTFPGMSWETIQREFPTSIAGACFPTDTVWWPQTVENDAHIIRRAERLCRQLWSRHGETDDHVLLISHSDTIGRLVEAFLKSTPVQGDPEWTENCAVTCLSVPSDQHTPATIICRNDSAHLT